MEDTLRGCTLSLSVSDQPVLILVLMEDTLRGQHHCCLQVTVCLNPCFNGRYSQSPKLIINHKNKDVLILVLMEDTLRAVTGYICKDAEVS